MYHRLGVPPAEPAGPHQPGQLQPGPQQEHHLQHEQAAEVAAAQPDASRGAQQPPTAEQRGVQEYENGERSDEGPGHGLADGLAAVRVARRRARRFRALRDLVSHTVVPVTASSTGDRPKTSQINRGSGATALPKCSP